MCLWGKEAAGAFSPENVSKTLNSLAGCASIVDEKHTPRAVVSYGRDLAIVVLLCSDAFGRPVPRFSHFRPRCTTGLVLKGYCCYTTRRHFPCTPYPPSYAMDRVGHGR